MYRVSRCGSEKTEPWSLIRIHYQSRTRPRLLILLLVQIQFSSWLWDRSKFWIDFLWITWFEKKTKKQQLSISLNNLEAGTSSGACWGGTCLFAGIPLRTCINNAPTSILLLFWHQRCTVYRCELASHYINDIVFLCMCVCGSHIQMFLSFSSTLVKTSACWLLITDLAFLHARQDTGDLIATPPRPPSIHNCFVKLIVHPRLADCASPPAL